MTFGTSNLLVFRTTVEFFTYKPQSFQISQHFVLNSNSVINFTQLSYEAFLRRPNGSELKLCLKIAEINFSYFVKIPPWLEMVGGKISHMQRVKNTCSKNTKLGTTETNISDATRIGKNFYN